MNGGVSISIKSSSHKASQAATQKFHCFVTIGDDWLYDAFPYGFYFITACRSYD
jgi:hypothetical protein